MKFHVFPQGPMCSIRRALLLWLVPVFLAVGATAAAVSYYTYCEMVSGFMDEQMQQLATAVAATESMRPPQQSAERVFKWGGFVVRTFDSTGKLLATSYPELTAPLHTGTGFADLEDEGRSWRGSSRMKTR